MKRPLRMILKLRHVLTMLTIVGLCLVQAQASENFLTDIYMESYKIPAQKGSADFQRIETESLKYKFFENTVVEARPFIGVENYQSSETQNNIRAQIGLKKKLLPWMEAQVSLQRALLNAPAVGYWQFILGLTGGDFWKLPWTKTFAEAYAEGFFFAPTTASSYFAAAASGRVGYRWYEQNHFIIDPLIVEARVSDNSNKSVFGSDYQMINVGPRVSYWISQPEASTSLFVSKSWVNSYTEPNTVAQYWILWSLGVKF